MKWVLGFLLLIAAGLGGSYWWAGKDEVPLTQAERAAAPGKFVDLTDGKLHYLERGPENGPVILMVHGYSTPHFIFEQNAASLAAYGFRVIQFDHFGRGWSDRPSKTYDADFYDRSMIELLDTLEISQPVGLVGLSMGGIISTEFTVRHPERVEKLFLLVPAGLALSNADSTQTQISKMPVVGDWVWRVFGKQAMLNHAQYDETDIPEMKRLQGDVTEQMKYQGYFPALLSTLRNLPMTDRDEVFVSLAETAIPVLAVFGENDQVVPIEAAARMRQLTPSADIRELSQAGHGLNYQDFAIINPWLVEFFGSMLPSPEPGTAELAAAEPE